MSYLGKEPTTASFNSDTFSGDGSTVAFVMSQAPGSAGAVIVTIDGTKQHTSAYSVAGTTLTFTAAPPSGTNNIEVIHLGVRTEIQAPGAGTVGQNEMVTTGSNKVNPVVQVVYSQDSAVATGTTTVPNDDTIPQNSEGDQYMSVTITPTSATNLLVVEHVFVGSYSTISSVMVSLFQDSTANALATVFKQVPAANYPFTLSLKYIMVAGTTSATTFKIRAGGAAAGTTTFNGQSGARKFGGVAASHISVTEVQQ